jgi:DNA repair exonuclease SbcCD nuclease subunit
MKWLITADVHVYLHKRSTERLQDCLNALEWAFQTAVDHSVDHVFIAGDVFFDRYKIDVPTYQKTFEIFKRFTDEHDFKVWVLVGNHDMFLHQKWDISSVIPLSGIPSVTVINKPCKMQFGDTSVGFLPYTADPIAALQAIESEAGANDVLFGHVALDDAALNPLYNTRSDVQIESDGDMIKVGADIFKNWKRVFLGHYHAAQSIGDVQYVGSPLQLSFGEAFQDKHLIIYHVATDYNQYVENDFSPKHFIIGADEVDKHDLKGHFVRVKVKDWSSTDILALRKRVLEELGAKSFETESDKPKEEAAVTDEMEIDAARSVLEDEERVFERYVDECIKRESIPGLKKDKLMTLCKRVIERARKKSEGKDDTHEELEL